jgi:beta-galactosidase
VVEEVRTAGPATSLLVRVDRGEIEAGVRDIAHVEVAIVDADGTVVPTADHLVRFTVEGPARLRAIGNGDPTDHGAYQASERRAFHGRLLAFIQSTDERGMIRVTAHADGIESASVDITAVAGERYPRLR